MRLYSQADVYKIFHRIPNNALLGWARAGLVSYEQEIRDNRGCHRLYSKKDLYKIGIVEHLTQLGLFPDIIKFANLEVNFSDEFLIIEYFSGKYYNEKGYYVISTDSIDFPNKEKAVVFIVISLRNLKNHIDSRIEGLIK